MTLDEIYARASEATGKPDHVLRRMAEQVFASMLHQAMQRPDELIWTVTAMNPFSVEVDVPRRRDPGRPPDEATHNPPGGA